MKKSIMALSLIPLETGRDEEDINCGQFDR